MEIKEITNTLMELKNQVAKVLENQTTQSLIVEDVKLEIEYVEVKTDNGSVFYEGELNVGTNIFMLDPNGMYIPATDGTYGDIVVISGKVSEIKGMEVEPTIPNVELAEPEINESTNAEPKMEDSGEDKFKMLEDKFNELSYRINELENKLSLAVQSPVNLQKQEVKLETVEINDAFEIKIKENSITDRLQKAKQNKK